jgi:hypothetical protein
LRVLLAGKKIGGLGSREVTSFARRWIDTV